ncbi:hypothetical protein DBR43_07815 [Pedobacter sp. KBW06]|uniref:hypothetical protein n=1 Tax=Pedobacter sp. KBW06 TaxID=2153359 RepID=UPI000F5942BC|nr:hypothetical protein [Pedobacter sp. KBW06]RQO75257.1 hypothetical protein DBR43_07815 [Pedobacter sp. KBW06]
MLHWVKITEQLPEEQKPVFLIKEESQNIKHADIGCLVTSDDGKLQGFHIDNDTKVVKLEARFAWMYLEEKSFFVPDLPDAELEPTVLDFLERLAFFDKKLTRLSAWMVQSGQGLYHLDFYITGIVSRSLSLINGFETLVKSRNYLSALHLVRPHLDNFMRLHAAWLCNDPHDFAFRVWKGEQVQKIRDKDNKPLKDWYLKEKVSELYPWIANVYNETSGFIHFSNKHIAGAVNTKDENLTAYISKNDNNIPNKDKLETIMCMIEITNCIANHIFGWIDTKRIKG